MGRHAEGPVSYTHLDVYKRQIRRRALDGRVACHPLTAGTHLEVGACQLRQRAAAAKQRFYLSLIHISREVINITELNAEIKRIVAREQVLRDEIDKIVAEIEGC